MTTKNFSGQNSGPLTILVVTDEARLATEVEFGAPAASTVIRARDARAAWELMKSMTPSVAVVDLQTGSAGGYGLARDMAADPWLARVPILMVLERPQDAWLAAQAGAAAHVTKPIDTGELLAAALALIG